MKPDHASIVERQRGEPPFRGLLIVLLATLLAYSNSFAGVWQFDDHAVLLADHRVQTLTDWWHSLPHIRPLFKLTVAVNHELGWGLYGFHAFNLALHLANIILLYAIFRQLLAGKRLHQRAAEANTPSANILLWLVTIVFALHPAQTEVVTYLSGRSVALEAFGLLLACHALLLYQQHRQWRWFLLMTLGCALALASRESAVIAPFLLGWLLLGWRWRHRDVHAADAKSKSISPSRWQLLGVALLASALLLTCVLLLPRYRELLWLALQWPDFAVLLASQSQAVRHLLTVALGLAPVNADPALQIAPLSSPNGVVAMLLLSALILCCWHLRKRQPLLIFALGWLAIVWLPTHSIFIRLDPVNDRQLYLALPAVVLLLWGFGQAWLPVLLARISAGWNRLQLRRVSSHFAPRFVLPLLLITVLAMATALRNPVYHSERQFWQDVVGKAPHNARGWNNLAIAYAHAGDRQAAELALQQALQRRPDYLRAAVNLKLLRAGHALQ